MLIFWRSDIYDTGRITEDGDPIHGEAAYLIAEDDKGYRWHGPVVASTEDGLYGADFVNAADNAVDAVRERIADGFDPRAEWPRTSSCYGSAAWGPEDEAELAAFD